MGESGAFLARATTWASGWWRWRWAGDLILTAGAGATMMVLVLAGNAVLDMTPNAAVTVPVTEPADEAAVNLDPGSPLVRCEELVDYTRCVREAT